MYSFTKDWFEFSELKKNLFEILVPSAENHILEIGSHEGRCTCYLSDNFLDHPNSTLTCVDPFTMTTRYNRHPYETFHDNIRKSENFSKITVKHMTSDEFFEKNEFTYSFIYVDGDHTDVQVKKDSENSIQILKNDGIIWWDDTSVTAFPNVKYHIKRCIKNHGLTLIHKSKNQIGAKRTI